MMTPHSAASPPGHGSLRNSRRTLTIVVVVVATLVAGLVVGGVLVPAARRQFQTHTSDKELTVFYRQNRDVMTRFAELSLDSPEIAHMWPGKLELKDGRTFNASEYSDPNWVELDHLLSRLTLVGGTLVCRNRVFMYNVCRGMAPGSCKGYLFTRELQAPVLDSLDHDPPPRLDDYKRAYKRIDDHWYLVYEVFRGARNSDTGCLGTFDSPISNKYEGGASKP